MPVVEKSLDQILATQEQAGGLEGAGLCRLSGHTLLQIRGADAREFLSRQLSCDVSELGSERSVHGAWLSAKGRVQALVRLVVHKDLILMQLDEAVAQPVMARMGMFVLRNDVRIEPAREMRVMGLMYPSRAGMALPFDAAGGDPAGVATAWRQLTLIRLGNDDSRILVLGSEPALRDGCAELMTRGVQVTDEVHWNRLEVDAGVARLDAANVDAFIPQMLNLDRTRGVSFSKGCYPGQEIVARAQHLGRIKRRMFLAQASTHGTPLAAGASVHPACAPETAIGRVVRSVPSADGGSTLLAVITLDSVRAGDPLSVEGFTLEKVSEPPYGLTLEAAC